MSKKFKLSVPFGTDIHSVILTEKELEKVQSGKVLTKRFRDSMEGESYIFLYQFNSKQHEHSLVMYYDDAEGFIGDLSEAFINEL
ncbi:hypothetical protein OAR29_00645 [Rhodospirillales bacterium]|nr:hypothetical protein [Rhodospirillales bacterium]